MCKSLEIIFEYPTVEKMFYKKRWFLNKLKHIIEILINQSINLLIKILKNILVLNEILLWEDSNLYWDEIIYFQFISGYSYSLDALSDEDEMDSSSSEGTGQPLSRNQSYSAITAAQLAAAIASATGNFPATTSSGPTIPTNNSVITSEMFSQAMQQAFATVSPSATPATSGNVSESMDTLIQRLNPQLQQMREMGLTNDVINVQALQATSGDVQAAIDLVFSGAMSPDWILFFYIKTFFT